MEKIKRNWQYFKRSAPGKRFQDRYARRRAMCGERPRLKRLGTMAAGGLITLIALPLIPAPGPGWTLLFIGVSMISGESLAAARFMDRTEVKLRAAADRTRRSWHRLPLLLKTLACLLAAGCAAAALYASFLLVRSGPFWPPA